MDLKSCSPTLSPPDHPLTQEGSTALLDAAVRGNTDAIKMLLAFSADVNVRRSDGATPLGAAVLGGDRNLSTARVLLKAGENQLVSVSQQS